jgi:4-hydroxybenzoate polyprenyltransferase
VLPARADVVPLPPRRGATRAALVSLRAPQWTKNLLVFAGLVFAARLGDAELWRSAAIAFGAYCLASSAAYVANDLHDASADRHHRLKRRRPIARGELSRPQALALATSLAVAALALAAQLGPASAALIAGFLALQAVYTALLRAIALVDVIAIACLFVIRAAAGAIAIDVRISSWLLVCTGLLALLLALGKRRAEASAAPGSTARRALTLTTPELLDQLLAAVAAATLAVYCVYTLTAQRAPLLVVTIPFVVYGVVRYLALVHRRRAGEDPENILLGDRPMLLTVVGWTTTCAVLLQSRA